MADAEIKNYLAGVGIALCSTACNAVGLTCQKLTHKKLLTAGAPKDKRYFLQPLWLLGILAMVAGAGLSFAVFNFLGQSRSSAMASITIVWNGVAAALFLGERFTLWDAVVTVIIIGGAVVSVVFGSVGSASQSNSDIDGIVKQLSRNVVWIAGTIIAIAWIAMYISVRRIARKGSARSPRLIRLECYQRIILSGIMTGVTGMLASSAVKCIGGAVRAADVSTIATRFEFWLFLLCLPFSLVLQLGFLNSALAQMEALEIVPPYQAAVIIIGLLWGWLFTGDAEGATSLSMGMFACGCIISCIGVGMLTLKRTMVVRVDAWLIKRGYMKPRSQISVSSQDALVTSDADVGGVSVGGLEEEGAPLYSAAGVDAGDVSLGPATMDVVHMPVAAQPSPLSSGDVAGGRASPAARPARATGKPGSRPDRTPGATTPGSVGQLGSLPEGEGVPDNAMSLPPPALPAGAGAAATAGSGGAAAAGAGAGAGGAGSGLTRSHTGGSSGAGDDVAVGVPVSAADSIGRRRSMARPARGPKRVSVFAATAKEVFGMPPTPTEEEAAAAVAAAEAEAGTPGTARVERANSTVGARGRALTIDDYRTVVEADPSLISGGMLFASTLTHLMTGGDWRAATTPAGAAAAASTLADEGEDGADDDDAPGTAPAAVVVSGGVEGGGAGTGSSVGSAANSLWASAGKRLSTFRNAPWLGGGGSAPASAPAPVVVPPPREVVSARAADDAGSPRSSGAGAAPTNAGNTSSRTAPPVLTSSASSTTELTAMLIDDPPSATSVSPSASSPVSADKPSELAPRAPARVAVPAPPPRPATTSATTSAPTAPPTHAQ